MRLDHAYEQMLFHPRWYHLPFILLLLPLSLVYGTIMLIRRKVTVRKSFGIPIVSIGNLIVGGSGKTPFVIEVASRYRDVAVISRGYGRKSSGLVEVSRKGAVLVDVETSGDEPMLMAQSLPHASVIVSEDRHKAIALAKAQGAKLIILDDGFNRVEIEKFEVLLEPQRVANPFPFPAGPFREFAFCKRAADIVAKEGRDFKRKVSVESPASNMLLVTAISHPERLEPFLPTGVIERLYLPDHAYFDEAQLRQKMEACGGQTLLVTQKDAVKMEGFKLPLSKMKLKLEIQSKIMHTIDAYVKDQIDEE